MRSNSLSALPAVLDLAATLKWESFTPFTNQRSLDRSEHVKVRKAGIESLLVVLQPTDADGNQIYPILKAKLRRRLPKPVWNLKFDDKLYIWRRGKTRYIVSLELSDFYRQELPLPGPGPFVLVEAGWEEGESEDP
jgi:hypothetical protein